MQNSLLSNKFFVSVVTLCDTFYSRLKRSLGLIVFYRIDFSLKNKLHAYFSLLFVLFSFNSQ